MIGEAADASIPPVTMGLWNESEPQPQDGTAEPVGSAVCVVGQLCSAEVFNVLNKSHCASIVCLSPIWNAFEMRLSHNFTHGYRPAMPSTRRLTSSPRPLRNVTVRP